MGRSKYLSIQFAILALPPLVATLCLRGNPYISNPLETFACYCGASALLVAVAIENLHASSSAGYVRSCLYLSVYFALLLLLLAVAYKKEGRRNSVLIWVNSFLSLWSVVFGTFLMTLAMQ